MVASTVIIPLVGRIDMSNAAETEKQIQAQLAGKGNVPVELDAEGLEYISSAGLRVLLRLKKDHPALSVTGVSSAVYEILEYVKYKGRNIKQTFACCFIYFN